jgi:type IV pilus assembly protein PilY1
VDTTGGDAEHTETPSVNVPGATSTDPTVSTKYHERWVAFLNGGFDPQYVRGRGVHMVDVWSGAEVFDFSYPSPTDDARIDVGDPRRQLRYPVPGVVGMSAWGRDAIRRESAPSHDFLFDTATFADAGGQLWALRFYAPRHLDANGVPDNWYGARVFQMGLAGACKLCSGQPIFVITGDASIAPPGEQDHIYRTFFGTGDRFNLLDQKGGACGPANIRACVQRGCTVTVDQATNYVEANGVGVAKRGLTHLACDATPTETATDGSFTTCSVDGRATISVTNCPGANNTTLSTTKDMGASCVEEANGYFRCTPTSASTGGDLDIDPTAHPIGVGNWFMSLLVWEKNTDRDLFWDLAGAKRYDAARLYINQTGMSSYTRTTGIVVHGASENPTTIDPASWANASSKGWALNYDHDGQQIIDYHSFTVDWRDERTTAGAAFGPNATVTWRTTLTPSSTVTSTVAAAGGCKVSKCTAEARRLAYHYNANALTGAPAFYDATAGMYVRSTKSYLQVPAQADQRTVFINQQGQIAVGLTSVNPEKGATNVGMSDPVDPTQDAGFIEVDRQTHACRHASGAPGNLPLCNK